MTLNAVHHNDHGTVDPNLYSPSRRGAKALVCLLLALKVPLAADPPRGTASPGEGEIVKQIFNGKLPNVPGKTLTVVQVDYRPGGFSAPHRHPASGFVFAYVLSGTVRSQVEGQPVREYAAGETWTEPPNSHHIVSANASKTKPARLMAYVIADDSAKATVYDK
jgi:quercetin dioxygenase-like cupin family protein